MTAEPLSDEALLARLVAFDTTSHKSNREITDYLDELTVLHQDRIDPSARLVEECHRGDLTRSQGNWLHNEQGVQRWVRWRSAWV